MMNTAETAPSTDTESHDNSAAPRAVDWDNPRVSAILSAAAKCFARKGFSATTLAEIGKELGLRKSIVHYYLDKVKDAIRVSGDGSSPRMMSALGSLWEVVQTNKTGTGLNIEVWSASRRDPELKRRAAGLQRDARKLIREGVSDVLGSQAQSFPNVDALSTLILATVNGLAVSDYLEGEEVNAKEAYDLFLYLLKLGLQQYEHQGPQA